MKKSIITIFLAASGFFSSAFAATVQLMPEIISMTGAGHSTAGRLSSTNILATDVKDWLGSTNRADGWYSTTGNADMNWGYASANANNQTITLPNMAGTAGVSAGLKMSLADVGSYEHLSFSFTLTPPASSPTFTYSIWQGNTDGTLTQIAKESSTRSMSAGGVWDVSYDFTSEQISNMNNNGDGKIYIIFGSSGGTNGQNAVISNLSLEGTEIAAVPEASTASLFLFGLTALMLRRRVRA